MIKKLTLAGALALSTSFGAHAGTASFEAIGPGAFGNPNFSSRVTIESPIDQTVLAGPFRILDVNTSNDLIAWCIDLLQDFSQSQATYDLGSGPSSERVNLLDRLFTQFADDVSSKKTGAAMQVAIWETLFENERDQSGNLVLDPRDGNFEAKPNGAVNQAATWLSAISQDETSGGYKFTFYENEHHQDLVVASPVPLPAPLLMLLGAVGLLRFWKVSNA